MASAVALDRLLAACKMMTKDDVESFMMGRFQEKVGYEIWIGSDEEICCLRNNESREVSLGEGRTEHRALMLSTLRYVRPLRSSFPGGFEKVPNGRPLQLSTTRTHQKSELAAG